MKGKDHDPENFRGCTHPDCERAKRVIKEVKQLHREAKLARSKIRYMCRTRHNHLETEVSMDCLRCEVEEQLEKWSKTGIISDLA